MCQNGQLVGKTESRGVATNLERYLGERNEVPFQERLLQVVEAKSETVMTGRAPLAQKDWKIRVKKV